MNFFQRQDQTRRASRGLLAAFAVAVLAVVAAVDLVVFLTLSLWQQHDVAQPATLSQWVAAHPGTVLLTSALVAGVIALASLYKTTVLSGGGGVVARSLGGVRVAADTSDPAQRRLLNVVEEMAIAAGVPMPEVYLLEQESGINAFAAGQNPANAALGITRGALCQLNRAQLQGVIAHEFSHILNGDMRLNVRLMGLVFGLLVIGLIGRTLLRGLANAGRSRKAGASAIIVSAAAALVVIGYVGLFLGRLIQAAVSRTRESLADASAVQFTRDPAGLRGALVKIAAAAQGSALASPEAEQVAHMLFAPGMSRLFATHPPLLQRLKMLDPQFDAREIDAVRARMAQAAADAGAEVEPVASVDGASAPSVDAAAALAALVGNPGTVHMELARHIRSALPEQVVLAGREPHTGRALLLALALDTAADTREQQANFIERQLGPATAAAVAKLRAAVAGLQPQQRVPVLLRTMPALRQLPREERMQLMACLNGLLVSQRPASLGSYVLRKLAQVHLHDDLSPQARVRQLTLAAVDHEAHVLFSVLAWHGHAEPLAARRAYEAGMARLFPRQRPAYAAPDNWAAPLDVALSRLDRLVPTAKEQLVAALVHTVTHDQQLTIGEAELLRTVCASLHCPLPPLLAPGHDKRAGSVAARAERLA